VGWVAGNPSSKSKPGGGVSVRAGFLLFTVPAADSAKVAHAPLNALINAAFTYNCDGKMVKAKINGVETYYVSANYQITDPQSTNPQITKYYNAGAQRIAMRTNGALNYLLSDHLGSTSLTLNATGGLVSELRYKAFGEIRYVQGTTPTDYRYTGQREQADIGLYYYEARWYDPVLGRFTQADNIEIKPGDGQSMDRYAYVLNNPILHNDPTGHCFEDLCVGELFLATAWMAENAGWIISAVLGTAGAVSAARSNDPAGVVANGMMAGMGGMAGMSNIELGSGLGFDTMTFAENNPEISAIGIEQHENEVISAQGLANLKGLGNAQFLQGNVLRLKGTSLEGSANSVFSLYPGGESSDVLNMGKAAGTVVKPGGTINILTELDSILPDDLQAQINGSLRGQGLQVESTQFGTYSPFAVQNGELPWPLNFPISSAQIGNNNYLYTFWINKPQ
jgi:RHS repeat-associated protein